MHRMRSALAVTMVATLAAPAIAAAHPGQRDFRETYPYASRLCAAVAAGHVPRKLSGDTDQISSACAQLNTAFTNAQNTYATAVAPLRQQALDALQQLHQTCQQARQDNDHAACVQARQQTLLTLEGLRTQVKTAAQSYHTAVQTARKTFWNTIRALKGGTSIPGDTTVGPGPASPIPSNSSVQNT